MSPAPNYWVVGAAQGGTNHHYDEFIRDGFWKLFWADDDPADISPTNRKQVEKSKEIKRGDYIAIKKKLGGKNDRGEIVIRAIGQVEKAARGNGKVRVSWLARDLNKLIVGTGWGRSIHGPFTLEDKNVREVFTLIPPLHERTIAEDVLWIAGQQEITDTTKQALINARIGQGEFRSAVLKLWDNHCAVTGSRVLKAINASHIKPWSESTSIERLDPFNGIPLVASLHALFDAGYISFDDTECLVVSSELEVAERKIYGLSQLRRLRERPVKKTATYLRYHRTNVFRG